jgi:putative tryptophan/tyrosine transport system substrate-binding protein
MRRREFIALFGGAAVAWPVTAWAQQTERMRRLGVLMAVAESDADARKGISILQESLQKLGWKDGNNIRIDYRWGNGNPDRIEDLAKELVDLQPDILVGHSTPSAKGLLKQTRTIPIIFLTVTDPLGQGLVSSLSHPGGNITGFSVFEVSLGTKWLEILKQIVPGVRRVTAIFNPETAPYYGLYLQSIDAGTSLLGIESIPIQVHSEAEFENVIRKVAGEPDSGLFVLPDSHNIVHRKRIIELTAQYRLPAVYYFRYFATDGGLISYGPDEMDLFRRTAGYVDQILKGARPSDLPVQQPAKFELVINLTTARALGLTIPPAYFRLLTTWSNEQADVCYWHNADIQASTDNVRFWVNSGHQPGGNPMSAFGSKRTSRRH